jgi:hypothetical protein
MEVDVSQRVHSVDVDIGRPDFDSATFEADIRALLPSDVASRDVMFIVDEIYVKEYWNGVREVLDNGFPDSVVWCAGLYRWVGWLLGVLNEDLYISNFLFSSTATIRPRFWKAWFKTASCFGVPEY